MRLNHPDLVKVCLVGPPRTHLKVLYLHEPHQHQDIKIKVCRVLMH